MAIASSIIAGTIAAAGAIGAAKIGSSASKKAAAAQQQGTDRSLELQRETRDQNAAILAPWQQSGLQANNVLMGALGFGGGQTTQAQPTTQSFYQGANPDSTGGAFDISPNIPGMQTGTGMDGQFYMNPTAMQPAGSILAPTQTPQQASRNAFDLYKGSTGYGFRFDEGMRGLAAGYFGGRVGQSGAAIKGALGYAQNIASAEYNNWLAQITGVADQGFRAASAQASVGQTYANNASALNAQNAATQAQLALAKGQNTASMVGALGQIGGYVAGNVFGQTPQTPVPSTSPGFGTILPSTYGYGR